MRLLRFFGIFTKIRYIISTRSEDFKSQNNPYTFSCVGLAGFHVIRGNRFLHFFVVFFVGETIRLKCENDSVLTNYFAFSL